jgi:hypothetical protein
MRFCSSTVLRQSKSEFFQTLLLSHVVDEIFNEFIKFQLTFFMFLFYAKFFAAPLPGHHNDSSCSSGPESPNGDSSGRTQYVSATCVVVTHYSGDVASVVDEHFTRALNFNDKNSKGEFGLKIHLLKSNNVT